jgi:predicted Zn-dependent protease
VGGVLPFSRKEETEADKYGLYFSSMAGYNPQEAIPFWERMSKAAGGAQSPEFLRTHPSDETRMAAIKANMPQALKYYKPVK